MYILVVQGELLLVTIPCVAARVGRACIFGEGHSTRTGRVHLCGIPLSCALSLVIGRGNLSSGSAVAYSQGSALHREFVPRCFGLAHRFLIYGVYRGFCGCCGIAIPSSPLCDKDSVFDVSVSSNWCVLKSCCEWTFERGHAFAPIGAPLCRERGSGNVLAEVHESWYADVCSHGLYV